MPTKSSVKKSKSKKPVVKKITAVQRRAALAAEVAAANLVNLNAQVGRLTRDLENYKAQRTADIAAIERYRSERDTARIASNNAEYAKQTLDQTVKTQKATIDALTTQVAQFRTQAETNGAILNRLLPEASKAAEKAGGPPLGYPAFMPTNGKSHY